MKFNPSEPNEIASACVYIGGLSVAFGISCYKEAFWPFFSYGGVWTAGFGAVYYLLGWWRGRS